MKKLFLSFLILFLAVSYSTVFAQQCGTTAQSQYEMREQMFENRANREAALQNGISNPRGAVTQYVPIKFHLVGKSDGTSVASESQILNMICEINNNYADQDIVFYIDHPFNYIYNTSVYNDPDVNTNPAAQLQIPAQKDDNAINIFITGSAGANSAGFYQPPFPNNDFIVIRKSSTAGNAGTHELGHFFSLAHPFLGWGQAGEAGWDPGIHGNPVGPNSPDGIPNEKMDMSNCLATADGICDTPPDYLFANSPVHDNDCTWEGGAMDPDGTLVVTLESNFMNYYSSCNSYSFTDDQKVEIWSSLTESSQRAYIRHSYIPNTDPITEAPELFYPIDGETTSGHTLVEFDWSSVSGATHYVLEIDFLPTFTGLPSRFIVSNSSYEEIEDIFNPNSNYYWRVRPYSDGYTCGTPFSISGNFKTGDGITSTKDIDQVNDWTVQPNPVSANEKLNIQMEASEAFKAGISLYSLTGQQIKSVKNHLFTVGANNYELDIAGLNPGIYIVAIHTNAGVANKKVVITK